MAFLRKLAWLRERRRKEAELREELEFHLAADVEERRASGAPDEQARAAARCELGSLALIAEDSRAAWGWPALEQVGRDMRYAVRTLLRTKGFAAVAVLSLALGIGANTAIFSVVHAVLIKPLPYALPEQIYSVEIVVPERREQIPSLPASVQVFLEWRKGTSGVDAIAALRPWECTLTGDGEPERLGGARVSANFFSFLGVAPAHGREFVAAEEQPGSERVVVISDGLWRRRYGADPGILGRTMTINGEGHVIVGVAPPSLLVPTGTLLHALVPFAPRVDIWKPIAPTAAELKNESWDHGVLVRIPDPARLETARGQLEAALTAMVRAQMPELRTEPRILLTPAREIYSGKARLRLVLILVASVLLLVTAWVNVINLFLARTASRAHEFATRVALGAGRARIFSQTVTETLLIACAGGAAGAMLAKFGAELLMLYGPDDVRLLSSSRSDVALAGFAIAASLAIGIVCGVIPAWHAYRRDAGSRSARVRQVLVGVEMALSTALLASAGLLLHSFVNVMGVDRGYQVERVLAVDLSLSGAAYGPAPRRIAFYQELSTNVRAVTGVEAAGAISDLPAIATGTGGSRVVLYETDTRMRDVMLSRPVALIRAVTSGYFAASGSALRAGRFFTNDEQQLVAVVSESLGRRLWPNDPPAAIVGRNIRQGDAATPLIAIVGVVEDARTGAVDREPPAAIYRPHAQWASGPMTLVVRTSRDPLSIARSVRAEIRKMDASLPIPALRTMGEIVSGAVADRRFQMMLTVVFAVVALMLGAIGLYGIVSYSVTRRTRDIGLRIALGAVPRDVMRWVFRIGMKPVLFGLGVGILAAVVAARVLRSVLFGVTPTDPLALGAVGLVLLATSALACYLPARRAASVDPLTALRYE